MTAMAQSSSQSASLENDDGLKRILLDRPAVPVSRPEGVKAKAPKPFMPVSGSSVVNQRCRLAYVPETGWYLLTLISDRPGEMTQPRWVLPSPWLEAVEAILAEEPEASFRVSGENTVYQGRAFILLTGVRRDRQGQLGEDLLGESRPSEPEKPEPARPVEATTKPASPESGEANQDDILSSLLREQPDKPIVVPVETGEFVEEKSVAPLTKSEIREDRGQIRVDRLITLKLDPESQWWQARFISDNTLRERPVRLLPCQILETAEEIASEKSRETIRLRVTGEIYSYKGHEYMLLRKAIRERDMGQF